METIFKRYSNVLTIFIALLANPALASEPAVTVWKSPSCGCCQGWVDYLKDNGFEVTAHDVDDVVSIKQKLGVTNPSLYSCHTAKVGNYVIEGHVPVADIRRLLSERPNILGLSAPGMPQLSPGMFSIEPKDYDVLQFDKDQETSVYSSY